MNSARNTQNAAPKTNAFGRPLGRPVLTAAEERMAREYTRAQFARMDAKKN